jgi:hypothetical protein
MVITALKQKNGERNDLVLGKGDDGEQNSIGDHLACGSR